MRRPILDYLVLTGMIFWPAATGRAGILLEASHPVYLVEFTPAEDTERLAQFATTYFQLRFAQIPGAQILVVKEHAGCRANAGQAPQQTAPGDLAAKAQAKVEAGPASYVVTGSIRRKAGTRERALELSYQLIKETGCQQETKMQQTSEVDPEDLLGKVGAVADEIALNLTDMISNKAIVLVSGIGGADGDTVRRVLLDSLNDSAALKGEEKVPVSVQVDYRVQGNVGVSSKGGKNRYLLDLTASAGDGKYPLSKIEGGPFADERSRDRFYITAVRMAVSKLETIHYRRQANLSGDYLKTPDAEILQKAREFLCEGRREGCEQKPEISVALLEERLGKLQPANEAYELAGRAYELAGRDWNAAEALERGGAAAKSPQEKISFAAMAGDAWMHAGEYRRAAERYQQAMALSPQGAPAPDLLQKRSRALRLDNQPLEALHLLLDNRNAFGDRASLESEIQEDVDGLSSAAVVQPFCETIAKGLGENSAAEGYCLARLGKLEKEDKKYAEAAANLGRAAKLLEGHEEAGDVWFDLAFSERDAEKYEAAAEAGKRVLEIRNAADGPSSRNAALAQTLLGTIYSRWRKFDEARRCLKASLAIYEKLEDTDSVDVATSVDWLGWVEQASAHFEAAEEADKKTLGILEKQPANYWLWRANLQEKLGQIAEERGNYGAAEKYYREDLDLRQKNGGEADTVLNAQHRLASSLMNLGRFDEARTLYVSVLEGRQKVGNTDYVAQSYGDLGLLDYYWGKYSQAEPNQRLYLSMRADPKREKPDITGAAVARNNVGLLLVAMGRYAEAEPLLRQALESDRSYYGNRHLEVTWPEANLGLDDVRLGRYKEARKLIEESIDIRAEALGADNPVTALVYYQLASLAAVQRDYATAERIFRASLANKEKGLPANHWRLANDLAELGKIVARTRPEEAERYYNQVIQIWTEAKNPEHPLVAASQNGLALIEGERGNLAKMELLCNQSLALRTKVLGAGHPDVAQSHLCVAALQEKRGNVEAAKGAYQRARDVLTKALGAEHPEVGWFLRDYADFLARHNFAAEAAEARSAAGRVLAAHAAREAAAE